MSTVLVVDDDPEVGRLLKILFELEDHQVVLIPTYWEVMPAMCQILPDVVIMDLQVQGRETLELVRQIRREEKMAHIPVVMTSGTDCHRRCVEAGADLFVLKPFLPTHLVEQVVGLVEH